MDCVCNASHWALKYAEQAVGFSLLQRIAKESKMKMNQPGIDKGERGESGERIPKSAKASDTGGERKARVVNGVGMGKADMPTGRDNSHIGKHEGDVGEYNEGRKEGVCYTHDRKSYQKEDKSD
jgi:hypothetical protein